MREQSKLQRLSGTCRLTSWLPFRSVTSNVSPPSSASLFWPWSSLLTRSSSVSVTQTAPNPTRSAREIRAEARGKTVSLSLAKPVLVAVAKKPRAKRAQSNKPAKKQVQWSEPQDDDGDDTQYEDSEDFDSESDDDDNSDEADHHGDHDDEMAGTSRSRTPATQSDSLAKVPSRSVRRRLGEEIVVAAVGAVLAVGFHKPLVCQMPFVLQSVSHPLAHCSPRY